MKRPEKKSRRGGYAARNQPGAVSHGEKFRALRWWLLPAVAVLTFLVFLPILQNDFVNWDDHSNLTENQNYRGLKWTHLRWMFTTYHLSLYRPLTWVTFGLDYSIWGLNPLGYHLTSLSFHCANAVLFYFIALRLLRAANPEPAVPQWRRELGAALAALLFSIHPLRVEAIAWASARNDVVSAFFLLLAVICYLRAVLAPATGRHYKRWMIAAIAVYGASLLAKGIGMTLPLLLLVLDFYPLRRWDLGPGRWLQPANRRLLREKVPFFALAVIAGALAVLAKREAKVFHGLDKFGIAIRIAESAYGLAFYIWKTILPLGLSPLYQRPAQPVLWDWPFLAGGLFVVAISAAVVLLRRRWPSLLAGWVSYALTLLPVLGIVQFGPQVVADRYSYLACLGWALILGGGLIQASGAKTSRRGKQYRRAWVMTLGAAGVTALGALSWNQSMVWRDSERLWNHVLAVNPATSYAYNNLALEFSRQGKLQAAVDYYRKAVALDPANAVAHYSLGDTLARLGAFEEAIKSYRSALRIDRKSALIHHHLANALVQRGDFADAIENYHKALQIEPAYAMAYNDLGTALAARGDFENAAAQFRKAARLDSNATEPLLNLGNLMARQEKFAQAADYYGKALRIHPESAQAHFYMGRMLAAQGKLDPAVEHFRRALVSQPRHAEAHQSLIEALIEQGKRDEALRHYQRAQNLLKPPGAPTYPRP